MDSKQDDIIIRREEEQQSEARDDGAVFVSALIMVAETRLSRANASCLLLCGV